MTDILEDPPYPWEENLKLLAGKFRKLCGDLASSYRKRGGICNSCFSFNIKIHDFPDFDALASTFDRSSEEVSDLYFEYFLSDQLSGFIETIQHRLPFVNGVYQEGRSGGWLIINTNYDVGDKMWIDNYIESAIDAYNDLKYKTELDPNDLEVYLELSKPGSYSYSFGIVQVPEEIKDLIYECKSSESAMSEIIEMVEKLKTSLEYIDKEISAFKEDGNEGFTEFLRNENV